MITQADLQSAIAECNGERNPNRDTCMMLAAFYTIQDHLYPQNDTSKAAVPSYSFAESPEQVRYSSGSEFSRTIEGMDVDRVLEVMDEAMDTIHALLPRLYDGIMRQLTE